MRATVCGLLRTRFLAGCGLVPGFPAATKARYAAAGGQRANLPSGRRCVLGTKRAPAGSTQPWPSPGGTLTVSKGLGVNTHGAPENRYHSPPEAAIMLAVCGEEEMRIAITGAEGQLGSSLQEAFEGNELLLIDLPEHDVTDVGIVSEIADWAPEAVIHAAAMTDVHVSPSSLYPRAAKVPRRAVLRNFSAVTQLGISLRPWEEALQAYFEARNRAGHC